MKRFTKPLGRVCDICLYDESDPNISAKCPGRKSGSHHFVNRSWWVGILVVDTFGIRSPQTALKHFGEACWDSSDYLLARQFTDAELEQLKSGKARVEVIVNA